MVSKQNDIFFPHLWIVVTSLFFFLLGRYMVRVMAMVSDDGQGLEFINKKTMKKYSYHQFACHQILAKLRHDGKNHNSYPTPHGDWFRHVSCPHYFSEILIYFSFALLNYQFITSWFIFIFVTENLMNTGIQTHNWYKNNVKNYPQDRKAIIPFLC
eukprot:TRINITY_DN673_c0_g1_i1.p1 TRINITY_DN673_c0_g1~~TRINITY_DN673_c0_g1_i1.p1  ORF type:complete len:156 (-),score=24.10 TRINITY_DN673_c0_g1_i1:114-581(-)